MPENKEKINNLISDLWMALVTSQNLTPAESQLLAHLEQMVTAEDEIRALGGSRIEAALAALRRRQKRCAQEQEEEAPLVILGAEGDVGTLFDLTPDVIERLGDPAFTD